MLEELTVVLEMFEFVTNELQSNKVSIVSISLFYFSKNKASIEC